MERDGEGGRLRAAADEQRLVVAGDEPGRAAVRERDRPRRKMRLEVSAHRAAVAGVHTRRGVAGRLPGLARRLARGQGAAGHEPGGPRLLDAVVVPAGQRAPRLGGEAGRQRRRLDGRLGRRRRRDGRATAREQQRGEQRPGEPSLRGARCARRRSRTRNHAPEPRHGMDLPRIARRARDRRRDRLVDVRAGAAAPEGGTIACGSRPGLRGTLGPVNAAGALAPAPRRLQGQARVRTCASSTRQTSNNALRPARRRPSGWSRETAALGVARPRRRSATACGVRPDGGRFPSHASVPAASAGPSAACAAPTA